jgi:hypothetical protein
MNRQRPVARDVVELATIWFVGATLIAVPALVFFFSFGNVGLLGTSLGVDHWIAFLTGPAVDLSVAGCVLAASYLSTRGWTERQLAPLHAAAIVCGLVMVALNTGGAVYIHHWRLASFDAVGPMLLIGWGFIAPWLWRQITEARSGKAATRAERQGTLVVKRQRQADNADAPETALGNPAAIDGNVDDNAGAVNGKPSVKASVAKPPATKSPAANANDNGRPPGELGGGQLETETWIEITAPLYAELRESTGKRPTADDLATAMAAEVERRIAAGEFTDAVKGPSASTAKRIRGLIEERFPHLLFVHADDENGQEGAA